MATTAKIMLGSKIDYEGQTILSFFPDYSDGRNKEWASATPSLSLTMVVKPEVAANFKPQHRYTLTFEEESPA
jgi:hypothetical protein